MRLPDDDELYEVDQTYLGPPHRYIAPMRHKAIFAWLAIGPLLFVVMHKVGFPFTVLSVGLLLLGVTWAAMSLADHATTERPVSSLFSTFWHDLSAPRSSQREHRSTENPFAASLTPKGPLGRYAARRRGESD